MLRKTADFHEFNFAISSIPVDISKMATYSVLDFQFLILHVVEEKSKNLLIYGICKCQFDIEFQREMLREIIQ